MNGGGFVVVGEGVEPDGGEIVEGAILGHGAAVFFDGGLELQVIGIDDGGVGEAGPAVA